MVFGFLKRRRRQRVRRVPFPGQWLPYIERNVPMYARLPEAQRRELLGHVLVFLGEKRFEGAGGLELTDEIRVTIAAQACVLLLGVEDHDYYRRLRSIVVYPHAYRVTREEGDGHIVHETHSGRLGESWQDGAVVLSWHSAKRGAADPRDGKNVILHEFAHQLDQEDGAADGTPELDWAAYAPWARVLSRHYLELRAHRGKPKPLLDRYGATHEAEFFAVATECFFERPLALRTRHPELYAELQRYFGQDPAERAATPNRTG